MKNKSLQSLGIVLIAAIGFVGCNSLGKMVKNAGLVTYEVTPKPMEVQGDSVMVHISGKYPPKFFVKQANLTVTPMITYQGGEKSLKPVVLVGESATEKGTKISYASGGSFSYTDKIAFQPEMKIAELKIKATAGLKAVTKDFPLIKIADGTIATSLLVKSDEKALMAKDNFQKVVPVSSSANIYYLVNTSNVRPAEMNSTEVKAIKDFISSGVKKGYVFKNMNVSAYASPDGELSRNANLAEERANSASKAMQAEFKKLKIAVGTADDFYKKVTTAEDWDGFKKLMEASKIADKDLILRVLTMYADLEVREKEIKNLSKTYLEISDQILPKLRRAVLTLNAEEKSRTNEQISKLATSNPDSLMVEELLYAASLTSDMNTKLAIYKSAEKQFPQDWRGINNIVYISLMQNKVKDAQSQFEKANKASSNNPIVQNNMGIVARWKGDKMAAESYYKSAMSAGPEVAYNRGIVNIMNGNYTDALANFGSMQTFNVALATVLNGAPAAALNILDASNDKDAALSFYLKAIIGARTGKSDLMINNLKSAISKDASFKEKAMQDAEFLKFKDNADFKAIVG